MPPSPSGVAAYAAVFRDALAEVAPTSTVPLPAQPAASQSFPLAARLIRRLRPEVAVPGTVLVVEQAGRGLAEFWAAWWLSRRGARIWLMVHDVPALSGGAFFGRLLDRRGGRRVAALLSDTLGRRAERGLLARAERVFCLAPSGAAVLTSTHRLTRAVEVLPHVAALPPTVAGEQRTILVPGYVAAAADVLPLLPVLHTLPADWRLAVGACPDDAATAIAALAADLGLTDRVDLLGFTDEAGVRAAFARAAIVVRWRRDGWSGGANRHAVSGPVIAALAHGCALVTNDDRGARELLGRAGAVVVDGPEDLAAAVSALVRDPAERARRGAIGRALIESDHTPVAVAALLRGGH
ncbi:glycosyltransferase [Cellulomonas taurus]|uniref:glycosyltransferase n=1 Tax=Cellulomonas taurus TaxID=2729175 RepID=UPI00145F1042|nr:glycosyltransferase [Cellulomonas taurus]